MRGCENDPHSIDTTPPSPVILPTAQNVIKCIYQVINRPVLVFFFFYFLDEAGPWNLSGFRSQWKGVVLSGYFHASFGPKRKANLSESRRLR